MTTLERLGIDRMTPGERLTLAQDILESLAAEQPPLPLSDAKRQELGRRIADAAANPGDGIPWAEIEAAALARLSEPALLTQAALADWSRPEEDAAWSHLQPAK